MTTSETFVVREEDAERVAGLSLWMLADGSDTGGALGANRLRIAKGAAGAKPHYHRLSAEAFYVLDGRLRMLLGDEIISLDKGGFVVVPPGVHHAFAAAGDRVADLFITLTPGIDRFGYFRSLPAVLRGELSEAEVAAIDERFDVHLVENALWDADRNS